MKDFQNPNLKKEFNDILQASNMNSSLIYQMTIEDLKDLDPPKCTKKEMESEIIDQIEI